MTTETCIVLTCDHPPDKRSKRDGDDWVCEGCGSWYDGRTGEIMGHDDGPPDSF